MMSQSLFRSDAIFEGIRALLEFAKRASGAASYALFDVDHTNGVPLTYYWSGSPRPDLREVPLTQGQHSHEGMTTMYYPLRGKRSIRVVVAFSFEESSIDEKRVSILDRLSQTIENVYRVPISTDQVLARICSFEAELLAIKISERTRGLLRDCVQNDESIETVVRHVESVLHRRPTRELLNTIESDLKDRLLERKLVVKAKQVLEAQDGLSEEEAYLWLIHQSKIRRKRLRDVAREVIVNRLQSPNSPPLNQLKVSCLGNV